MTALVMAAPVPALACETEPDLIPLPGETAEALELRLDKTHEDQWVIRRYLRETHAYEKSSAVYIARVITTSGRSETRALGWATVQPLHAIKGRLVQDKRTLKQANWASCGHYGDGDAVFAPIGEIVFVFEGLPKSEQRPSGIDSIRAADARTSELLDALYQFGRQHPFKVP